MWVALGFVFAAFGLSGWLVWNEVSAGQHYRRALEDLDNDEPASARQHLAKALETWSSSGEIWLLAARAARLSEDYDDAQKCLDEAKRHEWVDEAIEFEKTLLRAQTGDIEQFDTFLLEAIEKDHPEKNHIYPVLVEGYFRNFDLGRALEQVEQWKDAQPERFSPNFWEGRIYEELREFAKARDAFETAIKSKPNHLTTQIHLGEILLKLNHPDEALDLFQFLAGAHPEDKQCRLGLAKCLDLRGQPRQASDLLNKLVEEFPSDGPVLAELGAQAFRKQDYPAAEKWLKAAVKAPPYSPKVLEQLGATYDSLNKVSERTTTTEQFKQADADQRRLLEVVRAIAKLPNDVELRTEAGIIMLRNHRTTEGIRWLSSATKRDPNHQAANKALMDHYAKVGNYPLAEYHRTRLVLNPEKK
jgi:tetratricopeptide (TPR) repeat protein